jgi:hypothetical protein
MVEWGSVEIRIDGSKWDEERTCASWDLLHIIEHALGGRLSSPFLSLLVSNIGAVPYESMIIPSPNNTVQAIFGITSNQQFWSINE